MTLNTVGCICGTDYVTNNIFAYQKYRGLYSLLMLLVNLIYLRSIIIDFFLLKLNNFINWLARVWWTIQRHYTIEKNNR